LVAPVDAVAVVVRSRDARGGGRQDRSGINARQALNAGKENPGLKRYNQKVYGALDSSAKQAVEVEATHVNVPHKSGTAIRAWLRGLKK
jgi:hypothetical protein